MNIYRITYMSSVSTGTDNRTILAVDFQSATKKAQKFIDNGKLNLTSPFISCVLFDSAVDSSQDSVTP